ncbi:uncharacterized protein LOC129592433 isoform X2 [Paramacrobiotus metropolitanus]|uniref:uncharacterized protein LOC129592433 isoform X2 n=1 Tax=Paramacrobiotus metropolitanus TaxID=2943436 RepID=UPI00244610F0|nr:uncharacterized protein LOC129592433 isoform X2 [Paramacrobiotus metropolitanus]
MQHNVTHCGWPARNFPYVFSQPGLQYTDLVLRPIWLFICTTGNLINIILLRKLSTFQAIFLIAVAVFDIIFMWSWFIGTYITDHIEDHITNPSFRGFLRISWFVGNVALLCSDWVLVAFSITRLLSIIDPFGVATRFTKCRMRIVILCLLPVAAASQMFTLVDYATQHTPMAHATWMKNWRRVQNTDATIAAPLSALIALPLINAAVIGILIKRRLLSRSPTETGQCMSVPNGRQWVLNIETKKGHVTVRSHGRDKRTSTAVRLLTASVVMYLVFRIPFATWHTMEKAEQHCLVHLTDDQAVILQAFYFQFLYANYSVNFLIYCGVSRKFFARAAGIIGHCRCQPPHSARGRSKSTQLSTAATISGHLEGTLEGQARREPQHPIVHDDKWCTSHPADSTSICHTQEPTEDSNARGKEVISVAKNLSMQTEKK